MEQSDVESDGDESHGTLGFFSFFVAWWQPVLGPVLSDSLLELSGSCLPFLRPGWPSLACQPP